MITRYFNIDEHLKPARVLIIYGARRVGKTTLLQSYITKSQLKCKFDSGDNINLSHIFDSQDFTSIFNYVEGYEMLVIDEAQQIKNIGMGLKILVDHKPQLKIIVSGSASFELSQKLGEPLTGRKTVITLYPISQIELNSRMNKHELMQQLNNFLIYGSYPEVIMANTANNKRKILTELTNSYLLKDILMFDKVKNSKTILNLLKLLAFQVGNLLSFNELAVQLKINVRTVERYIDLLEKTFVIYRLTGLSGNLRNEITSKSKYYFYDNGIRNSIIMNFNELNLRNDIGMLWENFVIIEFLKKNSFMNPFINRYFWKDYAQHEIDYVEEHNGEFVAFECKWAEKKYKFPVDFLEKYKPTDTHIITNKNYLNFIL